MQIIRADVVIIGGGAAGVTRSEDSLQSHFHALLLLLIGT
jgi:succinate dehydrogenase/fumarate reductase flavoprotein subunit